MVLNHLRLFQFRCYDEIKINFDPKINIIAGFNGQGKTSLIEAIGLISFFKSFRGAKNQELIKINALESLVQGHVSHNDSNYELDVKIMPNRKQALFNGNFCKQLSEYVEKISAVCFSPTDIEIVCGSPEMRRNWIDRFTQVFFKEHADISCSYNKALDQRNRILKNHAQGRIQQLPSDFEAWTDQLMFFGAEIIKNRELTCSKIVNAIEHHYNIISDVKTSIKLDYLRSDLRCETNGQTHTDEIKINLFHALKRNLNKDGVFGSTSVGPHRDDIEISMNDHLAKSFGSQGEIRSIVMAMRLAEVEKYREKKGYSPILLIDDFSSELDSNRRKFLLNTLLNSDSQIFLTTTEELRLGKVFVVDNGQINTGYPK